MARLTPPKRFKKRADFLRLAARGKKIAKSGFVMQALSNGAEPELRLGFTATKKIGNAVTRNRAKRRLREAARLGLAGRELPGVELVLIARKETASVPFAKLQRNLALALDEVLT
ncbi:ribonuclease P protein component [Acidocella aromatica]|uniref:Ribonuclease P protein component n=1 Tax=Acidocella aromatica TaxID=1303579 RepID=A0A840V9T7_9PROT|nr:ribonuclease P protein component [Acidocella aromatica]MBB5372496.1 ribonuclease P protein component [Acidocella aromatica]